MRLQFIFQAIARFRILIFYSFSKYVAARLTIAKRWGRIDLIAVVPERPTETVCPFTKVWACGAAGSALPWHGRGRRFDPDQVHQNSSWIFLRTPLERGMARRHRQRLSGHHAVQRADRRPSNDRALPAGKGRRSLPANDHRQGAVSRGADYGRVGGAPKFQCPLPPHISLWPNEKQSCGKSYPMDYIILC